MQFSNFVVMKNLKYILLIVCSILLLNACTKINVYEKRIIIPKHQWDKSFVPSFTFENFTAKKTNFIFVILRHLNNYPYSNINIKLSIKNEKDSIITKEFNIPLTKNNANKEWANKGMDDIYEIKYPLVPFSGDPGKYTFTIENIMRDNPLPEVLSVGLALERKN